MLYNIVVYLAPFLLMNAYAVSIKVQKKQ